MSIENIEMDIEAEMKQLGMPKDAVDRCKSKRRLDSLTETETGLNREYTEFGMAYLDESYGFRKKVITQQSQP